MSSQTPKAVFSFQVQLYCHIQKTKLEFSSPQTLVLMVILPTFLCSQHFVWEEIRYRYVIDESSTDSCSLWSYHSEDVTLHPNWFYNWFLFLCLALKLFDLHLQKSQFWSCLLPWLIQVLCCFSYSSNFICFFVKPSRTVRTAQIFLMCGFPLETIKGNHRWIIYNIVWLNWLLRYLNLITMYLNCLENIIYNQKCAWDVIIKIRSEINEI